MDGKGGSGAGTPARLVEALDTRDPLAREIVGLLGAVERRPSTAQERQRVLRGIQRSGARPRSRALVFATRPAWVLAALIISAGAYAATLGREPLRRLWQGGASPAIAVRPVVEPRVLSQPQELPQANAPVDDTIPSLPPPSRRRAAVKVPPRTAAAMPPAAPSEKVIADAPDAILIVKAVAALRRTHDAATALLLARRYMAAHPGGPLEEEALSIAREAAETVSSTEARRYAESYLRRYPDGAYATAARATLARP